MLSEARDRVTLGLEIVSQELAALPAQEWVSLRCLLQVYPYLTSRFWTA